MKSPEQQHRSIFVVLDQDNKTATFDFTSVRNYDTFYLVIFVKKLWIWLSVYLTWFIELWW